MKKKLLVAAFAFGALTAFAGESAEEIKDEFVPNGKAFGQIFANYHQSYVDGDLTDNALVLGRAYFGYGYAMSENWSAKIKVDVAGYGGENEGGYSEYREMFLKEASLKYKSGNLSVAAGLIGLVQHKLQEKYWGHRYIYKSFQDAQKMSKSADIGVMAKYKINDMFSADFTARNGEGYKDLQGSNMNFSQMLGVTVKPIDVLELRAFGCLKADTVLRYAKYDNAEIVFGGFAGVKPMDALTAGVEYNVQQNAKNHEDDLTQGYSVYANYDINEKIGVFARYDDAAWEVNKVDPETELHFVDDSKSNSLIILGAQYQPYKKVKFALDYQLASKSEDTNSIFLHLDVKF